MSAHLNTSFYMAFYVGQATVLLSSGKTILVGVVVSFSMYRGTTGIVHNAVSSHSHANHCIKYITIHRKDTFMVITYSYLIYMY